MTTILIATDFSTASRNASLYGMRLAKEMKAKAILFTAYQVAHQFAALNVRISYYDARMQIEKRLSDEADIISDNDKSSIDIECDEGTSHEAILAIATEKGANVIIVGTKSGGGDVKKLFGSTITSLANHLTIPVIVVPEAAEFTNPKNVLYASDVFLDTTITVIDQVKWLTDFFGSKLFVVRVVKDRYDQVWENVNTPQNLREELNTLNTSFSFPVNSNTTDGLAELIGKEKVDLVMMLPHKHEWIERLFVKSETKDMALHVHVPILMLPEPKAANINTGDPSEIQSYTMIDSTYDLP